MHQEEVLQDTDHKTLYAHYQLYAHLSLVENRPYHHLRSNAGRRDEGSRWDLNLPSLFSFIGAQLFSNPPLHRCVHFSLANDRRYNLVGWLRWGAMVHLPLS